jgi:hexokinase
MGFTFSYPCEQKAINHGVLQRWTKGFDISGVEGHDVVPLFEAALQKRGVPIKVTAVVNDTTGTLIASNYADPNTQIGCIFGTGIIFIFYTPSLIQAATQRTWSTLEQFRSLLT